MTAVRCGGGLPWGLFVTGVDDPSSTAASDTGVQVLTHSSTFVCAGEPRRRLFAIVHRPAL